MQVNQSAKLTNVCYDIRGPVLKRAKQLEAEGQRILKLHIGNPAPFGFEAPPELLQDMVRNLPEAHGYSDSKGILPARRAVVQRYQEQGLTGVDVEDVYLGNGVSELIVMTLQALLDNGDQVLIPAPTTRCGRPGCRCAAARRCTTCATRAPAGRRRWTTSRPRSPAVPGRS